MSTLIILWNSVKGKKVYELIAKIREELWETKKKMDNLMHGKKRLKKGILLHNSPFEIYYVSKFVW